MIDRRNLAGAMLGLLLAVAIGTAAAPAVLVALAAAILVWIRWPLAGLFLAVCVDGAFRFLV